MEPDEPWGQAGPTSRGKWDRVGSGGEGSGALVEGMQNPVRSVYINLSRYRKHQARCEWGRLSSGGRVVGPC